MRIALLVVVVAAACGDDRVDKLAACELGTASSAATVEDRKIIGPAAPYAADLTLADREAVLEHSPAARREAAWQIVERVLAPVPLAEPRLAEHFGGAPTIPAWQTWYARDDLERVFKHAYRALDPDGRAHAAPIDAAAGFAWNATALDDDPAWPEARYLDYLDAIDTPAEVGGIAGVARVGYSPGAATHLVESYAKLYACRLAPEPDPFAADPVRPARAMTETRTLALGACELRVVGPFQAGAGEVRVATTAGRDVDLYVRRGAPPTLGAFDCRSSGDDGDEACSVDGGGPIYVGVLGIDAAEVEVAIDYLAADVVDPACLDGAMPRDAVLVKADWRRVVDGEPLPTYDTSAPRMAERLAGDATWSPDGAADPDASAIYTVTLPSGARFRLPALHVMTKELDHWIWITLWWSPDPDRDLGADRPAAIAGVWRNYKLCVATSFVEPDGAPTWCSNPYLERGAGNAATNCIGCHQHGGTLLRPEAILASELHGTTRTRNNFFTDYLWAVKGGDGDDISAFVQAEVDYWRAVDR
ncbi:MAG TPA: PPC domain-containing protein [Kofleriaceae bacterium]|nr:PPC domain-containing protein [Kofleriaceae bacterium]